jgi:hypothetical protein
MQRVDWLAGDAEVTQELPRSPGVFGRDTIYRSQYVDGPKREVTKVANGRRNDVENWLFGLGGHSASVASPISRLR